MADQEFLRAEALDEAVRLYTALTTGGQQTVNALMPAAAVAPDVLVAAGVDARFVSNTSALPRSPTSAELAAAPPDRPLGGMYRPGGQVQRVRWDVATGAWVANGAPIPSATQVEQAQATAEAAQAGADAATTALSRTGPAQLAALPITAPPPLVDGNRWIGQVGGTADALGTVVAAAGGNTWRREAVNAEYRARWIINQLSTPAARKVALQNAVAALTPGDYFKFPEDEKVFEPLVLKPAYDVRFEWPRHLLIDPAGGAAVTISAQDPNSSNYALCMLHRVQIYGGVRITNLGTPRAAGSIGLKLVNWMESDNIQVAEINNFEQALVVWGEGNGGSSYNHIWLGRLVDNKRTMICDQTGNGWSTQNTFYGGRAAWTDSVYPDDGWAHIYTTPATSPTSANDNNKWIAPSLESFRLGGLAADLSGNYNSLLGEGRVEFTGYTFTTPLLRIRDGAVGCTLDMGFDVYRGNILNYGANSRIVTRDSGYRAGGNRGHGAVTAQAVFDGSDKLIQGLDTAGTETFVVRADGRGKATGRWEIESLQLPGGGLIVGTVANNPNGVVSAPEGSLCLSTGGGTQGTWRKTSGGNGNTGWAVLA